MILQTDPLRIFLIIRLYDLCREEISIIEEYSQQIFKKITFFLPFNEK
jgi:hypothetical protein